MPRLCMSFWRRMALLCREALVFLMLLLVAAELHPRLPMLDILMIGSGLIFFALAVGYAFLCDRL